MCDPVSVATLGLADTGDARGAWRDITGQTAAQEATDAQVQAQREAIAAQERMYEQTRQDLMPYMQGGQGAFGTLNALYGAGQMPMANMTLEDFRADPGYQFRMNESMNAANNALSGMGMRNSGRALQALQERAGGLADQAYGDWYSRKANEYANQFNRLMGLSNIGQSAAAGTGAAGQNYAQGYTKAMGNIGSAQAANAMQGYYGPMNLLSQGAGIYAMLGA